MDLKELMSTFMCTPAPSGYEKEMAYQMKAAFGPYCDRVYLDKVGNCIGEIAGSDPQAPKIMVIGHMDSVGLVVRKLEDDGYLQVSRLGGTEEKVLAGTKFLVRSEDGRWHPAVIGPKAHHVTPPEEKYVVQNVNQVYLDMGARSRKELQNLGIWPGCPVVYQPSFDCLENGIVCGTSVDNRGACVTLVEMARLLSEQRPVSSVYLVGTVWEEFNLRGAIIASRRIHPDVCISLDVALAGDTPNLKSVFDVALGNGPCLEMFTFHGRGTLNGVLPHEGLARLASAAAKELNIPLQKTAAYGMLMDSSYVQLEEEGVATVDMGFPTRYTHTPVETCCLKDIEQLAQLCSEMCRRIDRSFSLARF